MSKKRQLLNTLHINISRLVRSHLRGNYKSAFKGQGIVIANSRPYVAGDDYRHMDWRTTAKKGSLYVKEYEEERQLKLFFVVQTAHSMDLQTGSVSKRQFAQDVLSALGTVALQQGDRVGGTLFDRERGVWLHPSRHYATLYSLLKSINPVGKQTGSIIHVLEDIKKHRVHNTLVVFLSDVFPTSEERVYLRGLGATNELLRIQVFDPFERTLETKQGTDRFLFGKNTMHKSLVTNKNVRAAYLEKLEATEKQMVSFFRGIGGQYLPMSTEQDPIVALASHFQRIAYLKKR